MRTAGSATPLCGKALAPHPHRCVLANRSMVFGGLRTPCGFSPLSRIKGNAAKRQISSKCTANCHQADSSHTAVIQLNVDTMRLEARKGQMHGLPGIGRPEDLPVGLPGARHVGCPQMQTVPLTVPENVDLDPVEFTDVERLATWADIQGDLHKTAVVFKADIAAYADCGATRNNFTDHRRLRDATHDLVGEQSPLRSIGSERGCFAEIVDDHRLRPLCHQPAVPGSPLNGPAMSSVIHPP